MSDPILVEVMRGQQIESFHRGAVCVVDADGSVVLSRGDVARPVFPRSAVKLLQALVLVESGAADHFTPQELALACASHGGEAGHVALAEKMLARAGFDETALQCGAHWPMNLKAGQVLASEGRNPSALHNNCSGKHAGFLCACRAMGVAPDFYCAPEHPVQREVRAVLEDLGGAPIPDARRAIDGCAIPTYAMPLTDLARAMGKIGSGQGLAPSRRDAASRLLAACMAEPWFTAGTGRFCTGVMTALSGAAYVKTGAEGVYAAAVPALGLGIAVKADDGAGRAAEVVTAAMLMRLLPDRAELLRPFIHRELRNWNGTEVGALRPAQALTEV